MRQKWGVNGGDNEYNSGDNEYYTSVTEGDISSFNRNILLLSRSVLLRFIHSNTIVGAVVVVLSLLPAALLAQNDSIYSEQNERSLVLNERIALKNNILYDAAATPNLQVEVAVAPRWTLGLMVGYNPFPVKDDKFPKWRHVAVMPEARYWFCQTFYRDYISVDFLYSHYNAAGGKYPAGWLYKSLQDKRMQGDLVALGVAYGWSWILAPHWSIELEGGLNAGYAWYDEYECKYCGDEYGRKRQFVLIPRFALNIIWQIR